jgi:hypothetical protein
VPALGSAEKQDHRVQDVRAYILFRKPGNIRLTPLPAGAEQGLRYGLYRPISNSTFRAKPVPGRQQRNRAPFREQAGEPAPQHLLKAILVRPIDADTDKLPLKTYRQDNAFYIVQVIHQNGNGQLQLARTIWFNRYNLLMARQLVFDPSGNILTDARYTEWKAYDNVAFPKVIEINRPRDEYAVVSDVVKMDINKGISQDKFVLEQPEGSTLQVVDPNATPPAAPPTAPPAPPAKGRTKKK